MTDKDTLDAIAEALSDIKFPVGSDTQEAVIEVVIGLVESSGRTISDPSTDDES